MRRLVLLPALLAILVGAPPALAWTWPVDGPVLQPFALGDDPYASGQHRGIDVGTAEGVPVRAPAPGTVTFAGTVPGGGRTITIQTPDGLAVTLLHLGAVLVSEGDAVAEGAEIGVAGWSGDPEHAVASVHLGVRVAAETDGYLDPLSLLPPPPASNDVAAEDEPDEQDEPAAIPVVEVEPDRATAPPVEVETVPSELEAAEAPSETLPLVAQSGAADSAAAAAAAVAPLEPLVVVSAGSTAPPAASPAPADAALPEPSGRPQPVNESVTEAVEAASPAPASSRGDPTVTPQTAALVAASAPASRPEGDERRRRAAGRIEHARRPHRARIDRRAEPVAEAGVAAARREAGSVEHATRTLSHGVRQPEQGATPVSASGGRAWFWRLGLAAILAVVGSLLLMSRAGRGGRGTAGREIPSSAPPLGGAQGDEPDPGIAPAAPAPRRDARGEASRPGRRLERGGPGGPAKRPAAVLRGRRASV